jgi:hypothetical protein
MAVRRPLGEPRSDELKDRPHERRRAWPRDSTGGGWLDQARRPEVVRRGLRVAAIVGTILVSINYADEILAGSLSRLDWIKMGLTYVVPYCVSTYTAVAMVRERR